MWYRGGWLRGRGLGLHWRGHGKVKPTKARGLVVISVQQGWRVCWSLPGVTKDSESDQKTALRGFCVERYVLHCTVRQVKRNPSQSWRRR